jgi:hypothetical protein
MLGNNIRDICNYDRPSRYARILVNKEYDEAYNIEPTKILTDLNRLRKEILSIYQNGNIYNDVSLIHAEERRTDYFYMSEGLAATISIITNLVIINGRGLQAFDLGYKIRNIIDICKQSKYQPNVYDYVCECYIFHSDIHTFCELKLKLKSYVDSSVNDSYGILEITDIVPQMPLTEMLKGVIWEDLL